MAEQSATTGQRLHSLAGSAVGLQSLWIDSTGHVRQIVRGIVATDYETMLLESDSRVDCLLGRVCLRRLLEHWARIGTGAACGCGG